MIMFVDDGEGGGRVGSKSASITNDERGIQDILTRKKNAYAIASKRDCRSITCLKELEDRKGGDERW